MMNREDCIRVSEKIRKCNGLNAIRNIIIDTITRARYFRFLSVIGNYEGNKVGLYLFSKGDMPILCYVWPKNTHLTSTSEMGNESGNAESATFKEIEDEIGFLKENDEAITKLSLIINFLADAYESKDEEKISTVKDIIIRNAFKTVENTNKIEIDPYMCDNCGGHMSYVALVLICDKCGKREKGW